MNKENVLEVCLGFIPVRIRTPGNSAHLLLPPEILLPEPHIKTVNIVVKVLDKEVFLTQSMYVNNMLIQLNQLNLLDKYIRRMVAVRIRKFEGQERLDPLQQVSDLVFKCSFIYALILLNTGWLILQHL